MKKNNSNNLTVLYWGFLAAIIVPICMMLFSFLFNHWGWGLMDDFVVLESGNSIINRLSNYWPGLFNFGLFRPVYALHASVFYTLFAENPVAFHVFRVFEVCFVMFLWSYAAFRFTKTKLSFFILPTITLSFHYFYDSIFFLSSQEILGLLFLGLSLNMMLMSIQKSSDPDGKISKGYFCTFILGVMLLLFAFWCKEPFLSSGVAIGLTFMYLCYSSETKKKEFFRYGILLILISIVQAFFLMKFVKSGYSSEYSLSKLHVLFVNFSQWVKKDLSNHFPWIIIAGLLFAMDIKRKKEDVSDDERSLTRGGIVLGFLLYLGYLLIILPWNTNSYYATPFGIFFAFIITLIISRAMIRSPLNINMAIILFALIFNQFVCQYALTREVAYKNNTHYFMEWVKSNNDKYVFNDNVLTNAMEAADAIPKYINNNWNLGVKSFKWSLNPRCEDFKDYEFYLYSPRFGHMDTKIFKGSKTLFMSKNWIMYQR